VRDDSQNNRARDAGNREIESANESIDPSGDAPAVVSTRKAGGILRATEPLAKRPSFALFFTLWLGDLTNASFVVKSTTPSKDG
jgi:hypothetical protein